MRLAILIVCLVIAAELAWVAGEMHYRNCVKAANEEFEALTLERGDITRGRVQLKKRIEGCSRLPF